MAFAFGWIKIFNNYFGSNEFYLSSDYKEIKDMNCINRNKDNICNITKEPCPLATDEEYSCNNYDELPDFKGFQKIPRLSRDIVISEKIDGSCGVIYINENNEIFAGSKNRWLDEHNENYGFWHWVMEHKKELINLGKGYHYGEWMGKGINRNYGLKEKRFYLFNTKKWAVMCGNNPQPEIEGKSYCPFCCYVVPILYEGLFDTNKINEILENLKIHGSYAVEKFMKPEGIIMYHLASGYYFKKTIYNDNNPKSI